MHRVVQRFVRGDSRQSQVLGKGDEQSVVDGTVMPGSDFKVASSNACPFPSTVDQDQNCKRKEATA